MAAIAFSIWNGSARCAFLPAVRHFFASSSYVSAFSYSSHYKSILHLNVYLIYFTMLTAGLATLLLQHILNKNPISSGTVLHENMGDGSYEFTVLDDRCTAHSLDDSSGQGRSGQNL